MIGPAQTHNNQYLFNQAPTKEPPVMKRIPIKKTPRANDEEAKRIFTELTDVDARHILSYYIGELEQPKDGSIVSAWEL
jgi:hypothetical protein